MDWSDQRYQYLQENGQMKYGGPPPNWVGPSPPKGSEVFISMIPRDALLPEILPIFAQVGDIYLARLMMDFSGSNRGFGFVQYRTITMARDAVVHLNGYELQGQYLSVTKSIDNCRLFIGQIPKDKSKEEVEEVLSEITAGVKEVILYLSSTDKSMNRGFCFVEYNDHRSAAMARRYLITAGIQEWGRNVRIDWAVPEGEIAEDIMAKVTVVYIGNLMLRTTETTIREVLCKVVTTEDFSRIRKVKDFAFVHFNSREAAEKSLRFLNGFILDGARLNATWSKPLHEDNSSNELNNENPFKKNGKAKTKKSQPKDKDLVPVNVNYQLTPATSNYNRPPPAASPSTSGCYSDSFSPPYKGHPTSEPSTSSGVPVDLVPANVNYQLTPATSNLNRPPPAASPSTSGCYSDSFSPPYKGHPTSKPSTSSGVPVEQQQYAEQKKMVLINIVYAFFHSMPAASALKSIASYLGWGTVHFKVTTQQSILSSNIAPSFTAQVILVRQNETFTYQELDYPPAHTREEAENSAANVFIRTYLLKYI